jgi:hypothetical protein
MTPCTVVKRVYFTGKGGNIHVHINMAHSVIDSVH